MSQDEADTEIQAMKQITKIMAWFEKWEERIKLGFYCVPLLNAHPGGWSWLLQDDAVNAVLKAFPGAVITKIRRLDKNAVADLGGDTDEAV